LFNDTSQFVKGGRSVAVVDVEEESGNGIAKQKRLRHFPDVQIPLKSVTHFQCPFNP